MRHGGLLVLGAAALAAAAPGAEARITKIQITSKQSPTFGGYPFKGVGAYEKLVTNSPVGVITPVAWGQATGSGFVSAAGAGAGAAGAAGAPC